VGKQLAVLLVKECVDLLPTGRSHIVGCCQRLCAGIDRCLSVRAVTALLIQGVSGWTGQLSET